MKLPAAALAALVLSLPMDGAVQAATPTATNAAPRTLPPTPAPIQGILAARRFTLATPFPYTWSKEHISVSRGTLVVLQVDPAYVIPREGLEPVLYAGDVPVQRLNHGHKSGRVIGLIPGDVDLTTAPIWFGTPQLPERITADMAARERAQAEKSGVHALAATKIAGLDRPTLAVADAAALLRGVAADLVLKFSPQEKNLAAQWRLPTARAPARNKPN